MLLNLRRQQLGPHLPIHVCNDGFAPHGPFLTVLFRVAEIFQARYTKPGGGKEDRRGKMQRMDLQDVVSFSNVMTTMASPSFFCSLHSATVQLFGQRNNVKVEKAQLLINSKKYD
jgi:hypothetical protein